MNSRFCWALVLISPLLAGCTTTNRLVDTVQRGLGYDPYPVRHETSPQPSWQQSTGPEAQRVTPNAQPAAPAPDSYPVQHPPVRPIPASSRPSGTNRDDYANLRSVTPDYRDPQQDKVDGRQSTGYGQDYGSTQGADTHGANAVASNQRSNSFYSQPDPAWQSNTTVNREETSGTQAQKPPPKSYVVTPEHQMALAAVWQHYRRFQYAEALRSAEQLASDEEAALEIRLNACVLAGASAYLLRDKDRARLYFQRVLRINPGTHLSAKYFPQEMRDLYQSCQP